MSKHDAIKLLEIIVFLSSMTGFMYSSKIFNGIIFKILGGTSFIIAMIALIFILLIKTRM